MGRRKELKKKVEEPKAKVQVRVEADEGGWMPVLSKRERRSGSRDSNSNKQQEVREVVRQVREAKKKPVQKHKKEKQRKEEVLNPHARLFHPNMNPNAKEFVPRFKLEARNIIQE